jgi:uncharacterized membrane protein YjfL (UPF0719 family)
MESVLNLVPLSDNLWSHLALDLAIAIVLLSATKWISGKISSVDSDEELCKRDNYAFGISVAGRMFALCIVLSGAVINSQSSGLQQTADQMLVFGILGLLLVKIGRFLNDKIILDQLDKDFHIKERNVSIALVDASSVIATAIIVRSVILWVEGNNLNAFIAIITGFLVTKAVLLAMTRVYEFKFSKSNQGISLQKTLTRGQLALAVQHSGNILSTAVAVASAANLVQYMPNAYVSNLLGWLVVALVLTIALQVILTFVKYIILSGIDLVREVDLQHNVGVACIEFSLSLGLALIISGLLSR